MTKRDTNMILLAGLVFVAFAAGGSPASASIGYDVILQRFIPVVEGFSPVPVWDYRQWSWGYGTPAGYDPNVKPPGTISRPKAWTDALAVLNKHHGILAPKITRGLNANQWAGYLSFSYNCGTGNADNLVSYLNAGDYAGFVNKLKKYVYAGGVYNQGLANRREKEADLFNGVLSTYGRSSLEDFVPGERIPAELITDFAY